MDLESGSGSEMTTYFQLCHKSRMSNVTFVILSLPSQRSSCGQGRSYYRKTCAESIWRCCLMNRKMSQAKDKLAFLPIVSCSSKWASE